jgi:uncharacterized protein (DUF1501 family)
MSTKASRREFLKTTSALSVAGAAAPFALNLASIGAASAQSVSDYKALVCLFMYGGNDHTNMVVPYDGNGYTEYYNARSTIAIAQADLAATSLGSVASQGGRYFALHPALTTVKGLYQQGRAAVVANVGPLIAPTTKQQYQARTVSLPPKLFSHNDQQSAWQAYAASGEGAPHGWGGTIGDLIASQNSTTAFTCVSAFGNAVWLSGRNTVQYQVSTSGALSFSALGSSSLFGSTAASTAYRNLITLNSTNLFENEMGAVNRRSIATNAMLQSGLPAASTFTLPVPTGNSLASQLSVVARMIAGRSALGVGRQVFMVSLGGFDNHDALLIEQARRMATIDAAIGAFWTWLGQLGMQSKVTLFTASDFGRTLTSNGDGSDHGWGSHHLVVGGAVSGGTIYGHFPQTAYGTPQDIGQGSLLPGISVDQYAATFARWMGVPDSSLSTVLPNIDKFGGAGWPRHLPLFPV